MAVQLEKVGEDHVDYMITANQLRSFNIHTTPLMAAAEVSVSQEICDQRRAGNKRA